MEQRDLGTFRERIARNRRNSLLLIAAFLAFITVFGYIIGWAWLGDPLKALVGLAFALVVGVIAGLISYYGGDKMVLAASRAREITHDDAPADRPEQSVDRTPRGTDPGSVDRGTPGSGGRRGHDDGPASGEAQWWLHGRFV